MRTTIVLDDDLGVKVRKAAPRKRLSEFVSRCLEEHFSREERVRRLRELEKAYRRAAKKLSSAKDFESLDHEDWPEW